MPGSTVEFVKGTLELLVGLSFSFALVESVQVWYSSQEFTARERTAAVLGICHSVTGEDKAELFGRVMSSGNDDSGDTVAEVVEFAVRTAQFPDSCFHKARTNARAGDQDFYGSVRRLTTYEARQRLMNDLNGLAEKRKAHGAILSFFVLAILISFLMYIETFAFARQSLWVECLQLFQIIGLALAIMSPLGISQEVATHDSLKWPLLAYFFGWTMFDSARFAVTGCSAMSSQSVVSNLAWMRWWCGPLLWLVVDVYLLWSICQLDGRLDTRVGLDELLIQKQGEMRVMCITIASVFFVLVWKAGCYVADRNRVGE